MKYGDVALAAVGRLTREGYASARDAWEAAAAEIYPDSQASRDKACPRGAFLGLCRAGLVKDVPLASVDGDPGVNGGYGVEAAELLLVRPAAAAEGPAALWERTAGQGKSHNCQMDVVLALWQAGLIAPTAGS